MGAIGYPPGILSPGTLGVPASTLTMSILGTIWVPMSTIVYYWVPSGYTSSAIEYYLVPPGILQVPILGTIWVPLSTIWYPTRVFSSGSRTIHQEVERMDMLQGETSPRTSTSSHRTRVHTKHTHCETRPQHLGRKALPRELIAFPPIVIYINTTSTQHSGQNNIATRVKGQRSPRVCRVAFTDHKPVQVISQ